MRFLLVILAFLGLFGYAMAQAPQQQQASPQQVITSLVNQQAQLNANITTALNQLPDLIKQVQELQAEKASLQKKVDSLEFAIKAAQTRGKK